MDARQFDAVARIVATRRSLVSVVAALAAVARGGRSGVAAQDLGPIVVNGAACASDGECRQMDLGEPPRCADNGFGPEGATHCCVDGGCCVSDADCCGDLRCAPAPDVCNVCRRPPFPTRFLGESCAAGDECAPTVIGTVACLDGLCAFTDGRPTPPAPERRIDPEAALAAAEALSALEAEGRFADLYARMHPHARAFISEAAVVGWYRDAFAPLGPQPAEAVKLRFEDWTWPVTGQVYPDTAVVAIRQPFADGTVQRDEIRLVLGWDGEWAWFFGRDREFVAEQVARYAE